METINATKEKTPKRKTRLKRKNGTFLPANATKDDTFLIDPRQESFVSFYMDPKSPTYSNKFKSALRAGYTKESAEVLFSPRNCPQWVSEVFRKTSILEKARANLLEDLELEYHEPVISMFGPVVDKESGEVLMKKNSKLMKIRQDASLFALEKLDKDYEKKQPTVEIKQSTNIQVNLYDVDPEEKKKLVNLLYDNRSSAA